MTGVWSVPSSYASAHQPVPWGMRVAVTPPWRATESVPSSVTWGSSRSVRRSVSVTCGLLGVRGYGAGKPIRMVGPSCSSNRGRGSRGTEPRPHPSLGLADHPRDRGVALGVDGDALAGDVGVDDVAGGVAVVGGADGAEAAEGPAGVVGLDDLGVVGLLDGGDAGHGSCLSLCVCTLSIAYWTGGRNPAGRLSRRKSRRGPPPVPAPG